MATQKKQISDSTDNLVIRARPIKGEAKPTAPAPAPVSQDTIDTSDGLKKNHVYLSFKFDRARHRALRLRALEEGKSAQVLMIQAFDEFMSKSSL